MPSRSVGTVQWVGEEAGEGEDRRLVMWNGTPDGKNGSRLTFFDIRADGFRWQSEGVRDGVSAVGWRSTCTRRPAGASGTTPAFLGSETSLAHPFGCRHAAAPPALDDLAFLLGARASDEEIRSGRFVLNGWGIQTRTYAATSAQSSFFLYDISRRAWRVTTFRMPGYRWTVWDGRVDDGDIVLRQSLDNGERVPRGRRWMLEPSEDGGHVERVESGDDTVRHARFR